MSTGVEAAGVGTGSRQTMIWVRNQMRNLAPIATLLALVIFFSVVAGSTFLTTDNLTNILEQAARIGILATGLTFVILCAEIDLSVANMATAGGVGVAFLTAQAAELSSSPNAVSTQHFPGALAIVVTLLAAGLLGLVTAAGVTWIGIPSFIMTLAMLGITDGIALMLLRGQILYNVPSFITTLGTANFGPVPWIVIVAGVVLLVAHLVLTYTRYGRYIYMVGGNREAAEYSGVNVRFIIGSVMVISAVCAGLGGMLDAANAGSEQQGEFASFLLSSISAVVVGGTSLFGGQGGIGNTVIGLFVLTVLNNGLDHTGIDSYLKTLISGLILLVALIINVFAQKLKSTEVA